MTVVGVNGGAAVSYRGVVEGSMSWYVLRLDGVVFSNLPHRVRHSPDGYAWGYEGSGPSELARCLLVDALEIPAEFTDGEVDALVPPEVYMAFKRMVVSGWLKEEGWDITREDIKAWFASFGHGSWAALLASADRCSDCGRLRSRTAAGPCPGCASAAR